MAEFDKVLELLAAGSLSSIGSYTQADLEKFNANQAMITEKLNEFRSVPGYLEVLLDIIDSQVDIGLKLIAVTEMKNVIKQFWENDQLFSNKDVIRSKILQFLLIDDAHENFFSMVIESIGLIAASDFPSRWPQFNDFFSQINIDEESFALVQRMLFAGSEVFKRFEDMSYKSDG
ncbi:Importin-beta N-terminal domain containing protein, partial [Trichomonas vaginalis G3]